MGRQLSWGGSVMLAATLLALVSQATAQVELRRSVNTGAGAGAAGGTIGSRVLELNEQGVLVDEAGAKQLVGWERVKRVVGEKAADAKLFEVTTDKAWRGIERLRRGDIPAAEPLFEELYQTYRGKRGPTASVAGEGLARCRVARGATAGAVVPWLHTLVARTAAGDQMGSASWIGGAIEPVGFIDAEYNLAPSIPPVWVNGAGLDSLVASGAWESLKSEPGAAGELATWYELAAKLASTRTSPENSRADLLDGLSEPTTSGGMLVRDILTSWYGGDDARVVARGRLQSRIDIATNARPRVQGEARVIQPRWVEAWCRFALGRSLVKETDPRTRFVGVIELLHLPARFGVEQPYLAGLALAQGIETLAAASDGTGAGVLKHELMSKYPRHPAASNEGVRRVQAATPTKSEE